MKQERNLVIITIILMVLSPCLWANEAPHSCAIVKKKIVKKHVLAKKTCEPKTIVVEKEVKVVVVKHVKPRRNRLSLLVGEGPTHLSTTSSGQVDMSRGPIGGVMFQRTFSDTSHWLGGVQVQTGLDQGNVTSVLGTVGYEF